MTQTEIKAYDALMADRDSWKERFLRLAKEKALCPSDAIEKLRVALKDATELFGEIMRDEVNAQDEAEKWLRAYAPHHLFPPNAATHAPGANEKPLK